MGKVSKGEALKEEVSWSSADRGRTRAQIGRWLVIIISPERQGYSHMNCYQKNYLPLYNGLHIMELLEEAVKISAAFVFEH